MTYVPTRVYLAGPYRCRDLIQELRTQLEAGGAYVSTASWLDEDCEITPAVTGAAPGLSDEQVQQFSLADLADVDRAQYVIHVTPAVLDGGDPGSGGRHVEVGYALGRGIPVVTVGEPENIFARTATTCVPDFGAAVDYLDKQRAWTMSAVAPTAECG